MKAKDLILLTTHLEPKDLQGSYGHRLRTNLRNALELAKKFSLNPIVVLGAAGDELLTTFSELENCDLTFDTNFSGSTFSSIQSGLAAASGASFVLKLDETPASHEVWTALEKAMWNTPPTEVVDVFQALSCASSDRTSVYPQLVSVGGVSRLQKLPTDVEWLHDPRLRIRVISDSNPEPSVQS